MNCYYCGYKLTQDSFGNYCSNESCISVDGITKAEIYSNGNKFWYKNGQLHRENGPAAFFDGEKQWYKNGQLHREDGPAIECPDGRKYWYKNDQLHREDGPAVEFSDGRKFWYKNGKYKFCDETNERNI